MTPSERHNHIMREVLIPQIVRPVLDDAGPTPESDLIVVAESIALAMILTAAKNNYAKAHSFMDALHAGMTTRLLELERAG